MKQNKKKILPTILSVRSNIRAGALTVYGSADCSWSRTQVGYLDEQGMAYDYVDCSSQQCPDFVQVLPTLDYNGEILAGFHKL